MMKRLFIAAEAALMFTACGDTSKVDSILAKENSSAPAAASEADVSLNAIDDQVIKEAEDAVSQYYADNSVAQARPSEELSSMDLTDGDIDLDLTKLNSNLLYAQVYDMTSQPEKYIGKKVRVTGTFNQTYDEGTKKNYFAVFIADAAACCQQGMEFELKGEHKYPDDYPEKYSAITVEGEFCTYEENGWRYCQLKDAAMQVI